MANGATCAKILGRFFEGYRYILEAQQMTRGRILPFIKGFFRGKNSGDPKTSVHGLELTDKVKLLRRANGGPQVGFDRLVLLNIDSD